MTMKGIIQVPCHMYCVRFLIDRNRNIRQEYSVSFLHDQLVTADIKTLLIEDGLLTADTFSK